MKSFYTIATALAVGAVVSTPASAEVTLTALTSLIQANPLSKSFLANFVPAVNDQCKGQVQVKYLGGPEVSPPNNAYQAIQRGQYDILHGPTSYYVGSFPEGYGMLATNVSLPEIHKNGGYDMLDQRYQAKVGAKLVAWGEKETGYYTYLLNEPKFRPDGVPDLSGQKMRATGTYRPLFNALGATTVNMTESEIYTALQRGIVTGFGWPVTGVPALGLHKIVKYAIQPDFYQTNTTVTMNKGKWESLTAAQRECLNKVSRTYETVSNGFMNKEREVDEKAMREAGMKFVELKGEARKTYLKIANDAIWKEFEERSKDAAQLKAKLYRPE